MNTTVAQLRQYAAPADEGKTLLSQLLSQQQTFDPDAWHVMQERDNALIRDELLHGTPSKAFVYEFEIKGTKVRGISVVGARELASQYKGIKSRIVATVEKRGSLFIFRTFSPLSIETRQLPELAGDDDFYECVMEVSDIKTGNSIEVRKKEHRTERKRDGTTFERPHFDVICESKAYRNGVLAVLPQSVIKDFQARCLAAGETSQELTIAEWRSKALAHATKNGIALDRATLNSLTFDELTGLGGAAARGLDQFKASAVALGLIAPANADAQTGEVPPPAPRAPAPRQQDQAPPPSPAPQAAQGPSFGDLADEQAPPVQAPAPGGRRTRASAGPGVE